MYTREVSKKFCIEKTDKISNGYDTGDVLCLGGDGELGAGERGQPDGPLQAQPPQRLRPGEHWVLRQVKGFLKLTSYS